jgi:hypothetical protein
LQIDLGNGTICMLQTHYERDMEAHERALIQDMLFDDGERLKARARIVAIGKEIEGINSQRALNAGQLERAEADYQAKKTERIKQGDEAAEADARQHAEQERRGPYAPSTKLSAYLKTLAHQQSAADTEREQTLNNLQATERMLDGTIAKLRAEAEALKAVVDGPYRRADR